MSREEIAKGVAERLRGQVIDEGRPLSVVVDDARLRDDGKLEVRLLIRGQSCVVYDLDDYLGPVPEEAGGGLGDLIAIHLREALDTGGLERYLARRGGHPC